MSKQDMNIPDLSQVSWEGGNSSESIEMIIRYSRNIAADAFNWYATEKKRKRRWVKSLRFLVILLLALGGIIPILTEIFKSPAGIPLFSPGWASVLMAAGGALVLFDRFFGLSSGWMRYTDAMMKIRVAMNIFDLEIADAKISAGEFPGHENLKQVTERCRLLVNDVNSIVLEETRKWDNEFRDVLGKLDEQVKKTADMKIGDRTEAEKIRLPEKTVQR
ncbi:MAG: SLATT domain-containing protein [Desulfococcaceae bacterium]|jgi:hypothetical protein|nr:SLATT domain-containing protein [Desulfococcaceae bacterium]